MNDRLKETFDIIHAEEDLKKKTKKFLQEKIAGSNPQKKYSIRHIAPVIVCFLFLLIGFGGHHVYFTETSIISIDINPSFEMNVNRFDKVISIRSYNKDGQKLAKNLDVQFMNYQNAIYEIMQEKSIASYLDQEEIMFISVTGQNEQKNEEMLTKIKTCMTDRKNVCCSVSNYEEVSKAHTVGLSFGKYRAFLDLQKVRPDVEIKDIEELSMRQIRELIENPEQEIPSETDEKCKKNGHGRRHRHGYK